MKRRINQRYGNRSLSRAFTLIEVLAASAAASLLMVGILSVVVLLSRDRVRMKAAESSSADMRSQWIEFLGRDLRAARSVRAGNEGRQLTLVGYGAIDPTSGVPNGRPARVTYEVVTIPVGGCLLRRQEMLDDVAHENPWTALAAIGISSLKVAVATPTTQPGANAAAISAARALPEALRVTVDCGGGVPVTEYLVPLR